MKLNYQQFDKVKNNSAKKPKDLGFQVSVTKTFNLNTEVFWEFLLSEKAISIWVGEINFDDFEIQKSFITKEGIEGKITVFKTNCHIRFKWKPSTWKKESTVELRITNAKGKARLIFHHTRFFKIEQKEELRSYWKNVMKKINTELINSNA